MKKYNVGDIIQLKSLDQCISEGLVLKKQVGIENPYYYYTFINVKSNPGLLDRMIEDFGKSYIITKLYNNVFRINNYNWPYEVIKIPITKLKIL